MTPSSQTEVRIIYSASPADRSRVRRTGGRRRSAHAGLAVATCLMNLLIGCALCYAVWWPIKANVWAVAAMKTPVEMSRRQMDAMGAVFGIRPSRRERVRDPEPPVETAAPSITGKSAQTLIWATAGGWISLMSLACVTLAASAGSIIGGSGNRAIKGGSAAIAIPLMLGLAGGSAYVVSQYGMGFPSSSLRWGVVALVALGFFIAAWRARSGRRLTRVASATVLIASAGSAAALYLGHLSGIEPAMLITDTSREWLTSITGGFTATTAIITLGAALAFLLLHAAILWIAAKRL
jgi:hypothetical protein